MTRVAVTGATGFVGGHLLPALLESGHEVRGLARSPAGSGAEGNLIAGDVRHRDAATELVRGCDVVIHLAASFSPQQPIEDIIVRGTDVILDAAREAGVQRFIYLGCLAGEAAAHSGFLRAKWKAEQLVRASELPYVVLRPSLILGKGDGVTKPLAELIQALPVIPVPGTGLARSQPVDVSDAVRCIQVAMERDELLGEAVSIGGPMYLAYRELADLLAGHLGVLKSKVLIPESWIPALSGFLPAAARDLFAPPRRSVYQSGVVSSPGIVERWFGFTPRSVAPLLGSYLTQVPASR